MIVKKVTDPSFRRYGKVMEGYDFTQLLETLSQKTDKPSDQVVYVPSEPVLESCQVSNELENRAYGGMPIQIGYCNGSNHLLNCLEYHRDSEIDIASEDVILLLGHQEDIEEGMYETQKAEAFLLPAGMGVELYATKLHYAPCEAEEGKGFRVVIVLPRGTNTQKPEFEAQCLEDQWMTARNKWLLAHAESSEAQNGAYVGLKGENLSVR